jgi:DNA-binding ferritin-like protein (Dps family)
VIDVKRLRGKYLDTFTAIRQYCQVASEHEADTEERLRAVLDKFLQAQEQDIPVERITGEDLRRFCENLWMDMDWKKRLWAVADRIKPMMWLLMGMCASMTGLLLIDPDAKNTLQIGGWMAYGFLACTAMVLWYLAEAVCKYLLRRSRKMPTEERKGIYYIAAGLCSFGLVVMWKIMCPTLLIPVIPGLVVCTVFLSGYYYLNK